MGRLTSARLRVSSIRFSICLLTAVCSQALPSQTGHAAGPEAALRDELGTHVGDTYTGSLATVLERGYLRVLTSNNSFDYFIYQGRRAGYQYEMVRAFTERLNARYARGGKKPRIRFEILPVSTESLIGMLEQGRGDLIAARMTITPVRRRRVLFSDPYRQVDELVVTRREIAASGPIEDLAGRRVAVRRSSSYHASLEAESRRLQDAGKPAIQIQLVDGRLETEDILALVANGIFDFSVADSIVADIATELYPELQIVPQLTLRKEGELAWAAPLGASKLVAEVNAFLKEYKQGSLLGNMGVKRYFEDYEQLRTRLDSGDRVSLSRYDADFRRFSEQYGFDWRLMAATAYQESRFRQDVRNRHGATGLFQIKPRTAREPYIDIHPIEGEPNAANNVHAGIKYLAWIKSRYFDEIEGMKERDRIRMTLAAYNAGPRTLINARNRAERMGLDPNRWFRNVELALLAMNRPEPVNYVSEINQRYLSYLMLGVE
jgi:membrane-bound lytic murein transglycosylase MltF